MGIYSDLQEALGEASINELSDAFRTIQFIVITNVYNEDTMVNTPTEVSKDVYCSIQSEFEGENVDIATLTNSVKIIILDSYRNNVDFIIDMIIIDGTNRYKLKGFNTDPAGASWTVYARRLG